MGERVDLDAVCPCGHSMWWHSMCHYGDTAPLHLRGLTFMECVECDCKREFEPKQDRRAVAAKEG